jgi:hypothetical protein
MPWRRPYQPKVADALWAGLKNYGWRQPCFGNPMQSYGKYTKKATPILALLGRWDNKPNDDLSLNG